MALTDKQIRFCEEYLIDLNATQAAIRAGYSENAAKEQGSRLLTNANIQEKIQELMAERSQRTQIKADDVLREFWSIAQEDIKNFLRFYQNPDTKQVEVEIKDSNTVDTKNVSEISVGKDGQFKFKLYCRDNALLQVGRHLGMFKDNVNHSGDLGITFNEEKTYQK